MKLFIFDLDHTVIDSSHRQMTDADGNLDLEHWFENATPEKIFQDGLMPLAGQMRAAAKMGYVLICTARTMTKADFDFLDFHGLHYDDILYRAEGDMRADGVMKRAMLRRWFDFMGSNPSNAIFYEDNYSVHEALAMDGFLNQIQMVHPKDWEAANVG